MDCYFFAKGEKGCGDNTKLILDFSIAKLNDLFILDFDDVNWSQNALLESFVFVFAQLFEWRYNFSFLFFEFFDF